MSTEIYQDFAGGLRNFHVAADVWLKRKDNLNEPSILHGNRGCRGSRSLPGTDSGLANRGANGRAGVALH
jgi:hypothetical protein